MEQPGRFKVGSSAPNAYWTGKVVNKGTWEVYGGKTVNIVAAFRAYDSVYNFYKDQDLLFTKSRYARVMAATTPDEQCKALYACGYATDPDYAGKLIAIIKANGLMKYDVVQEETREDVEKLELSNYQWTSLAAGVDSLLKRKIITDQAWLEKINKRTLTVSELAWLTFAVATK